MTTLAIQTVTGAIFVVSIEDVDQETALDTIGIMTHARETLEGHWRFSDPEDLLAPNSTLVQFNPSNIVATWVVEVE